MHGIVIHMLYNPCTHVILSSAHACMCVCVCSGAKLTGPFVTMIYKMLSGDLFRFAIIYCIFLVGFTQGRLWFQRTLHHCQLLYLQSSVFKSVVVLAQERERLGGGLLRKTRTFLTFLRIQLAGIKVLGVDPYLHIWGYCLRDLPPLHAVASSE